MGATLREPVPERNGGRKREGPTSVRKSGLRIGPQSGLYAPAPVLCFELRLLVGANLIAAVAVCVVAVVALLDAL